MNTLGANRRIPGVVEPTKRFVSSTGFRSRFALRIDGGKTKAGFELIEYLTEWLNSHTRLSDRMMAAFLRNHSQRGQVDDSAGMRSADSLVDER